MTSEWSAEFGVRIGERKTGERQSVGAGEREGAGRMNIALEGTIISRPRAASEQPGEKRITFLLFREGEVSCMSSLEFRSGSVELNVGRRVVLAGEWVIDNSCGEVSCFLFDMAMAL